MSNDKDPLDIIEMVQKARMQHDADARPSNIAAVYWIEAKDRSAQAKAPTPRSGQWVIETDINAVDALWEQVKTATEAGKLGYKSKVSTASRSHAKGPDQRVICVRTYDADDTEDVARVQAALKALNMPGPYTYERDQEA
jgi:hypothetical protein